MKVYVEKLAAELSKKKQTIYIVSGDEHLLVQESCDLIRSQLRKDGFSERELFHVEGSFDWEEVLFSANSMSLFAEKKLIELRIPNGKPGDKGAKAIQSYLEHMADDTVLLFILPKLDAATQRSKWFKALEAKAAFVQIWPVEVGKLPAWISARFRKVGLTPTPDAVGALIDRVEGNLLAASQEIERLSLTTGSGEISLEQVVDGVSDNTRFDVFGLIDAAVGQKPDRALKIVRGLRSEGSEMLAITGLLARELRSLVNMSAAVRGGQSIDSVLNGYKVWAKRKPIVGQCLKQQSPSRIQSCLRRVANIDRFVKGAATGEPWDELERLVLTLSKSSHKVNFN